LRSCRRPLVESYGPFRPTSLSSYAPKPTHGPRCNKKIRRYVANGTAYAIAIDPYRRGTYAIGIPPHGLSFDADAIIDAIVEA
jgi:hypothetical protein